MFLKKITDLLKFSVQARLDGPDTGVQDGSMNTLPGTVEKQETEEKIATIAEVKTVSGRDLLDSKDSGAVERMGCGASSNSNVLTEEKAVQESILQPAVELVYEMMAPGDFAKVSGGEGGKESQERKEEEIAKEKTVSGSDLLDSKDSGAVEIMGCAASSHFNVFTEDKAEQELIVPVQRMAAGDSAKIAGKNVMDVACSTAKTSSASSFPPSLKQNEATGPQIICGNSTDQPKTLDEEITNLYDEIRKGTEIMSWDALSKNSAVLSNWLLALGIGQDSQKFIHDSFQDSQSDITLSSFKATLKKEVEISRKLLWVSQTGLLRCIAESLPPAKEDSDPISGLRILDRTQVLELVQAMHRQLAECLVQSIADSPIANVGISAGERNNSKFCVDPTLFKMK